jgi:CheY-like chemotaxis protein
MSKHILVIDDDPATRKVFVLVLEDVGYRVDTAESGERGIDKVCGTEYDLIFFDLKMPGINGVETLIRLRDGGYKKPIYIATAFHQEFMQQLRVAADKGYEFEIMRKPIESHDLIEVTKAIIEVK